MPTAALKIAPTHAGARGAGSLRNEFSWSLSRDRVLRECARKYYYTHYGMWGGWHPEADARTRQIYVHKNLKTRQMWAGTVVHEAVRRSILHLRDGRRVIPVDDIVRITVARMRADWLDSKRHQNRIDPKRRLGLLEHEYDLPVQAEEWRSLADHVETCLRNFYASPLFKRLQKVKPESWLEAEAVRGFPVDIGREFVRVWVQIDCAFREDDGSIIIVNWKTGRSRSGAEEHHIQQACHALYAVTVWHVPVNRVRILEFPLMEGRIIQQSVTDADIQALRAFIGGSVMDMQDRLLEPGANEAREEDFPPTGDPARCAACPFRRPCRDADAHSSGAIAPGFLPAATANALPGAY